ncbi:hypothetical protein [Neisseria sp. CCUG12390]|uniref:hypothetical protein n=1 Tax=Neisseria sp. CCUG12390 TaxID=3392035 RepID=UPI003A10222D
MDSLKKHLAAVAVFNAGSLDNKTLKHTLQSESGIASRRLSRLSLIAALGAWRLRECVADRIRPDCAVYLATPFASSALFQKMSDNVLNHHAAMPFDFIANLHNAPVFHAAQALGSHGATVVCAADRRRESWQKAWRLAENALVSEPQIALGFCYERTQENEADGSVWLLLERNPAEQHMFSDNPDKAGRPSENAHYWQDLIDCLSVSTIPD